MELATMHPEDVKAGLRRRFGTIRNFERMLQLPKNSVSDLLRGKMSARVANAVEHALDEPTPETPQSDLSDSSANDDGAHRLISAAR
jgi:lambda repressor-like predicted transcriptional regulator